MRAGTVDDPEIVRRRAAARRTAWIVGLVAAAFYLGFIWMTWKA